MKNQKGITLVALIITIIVMLILAAVTISLALGEGGLFGQTQEGVDLHVRGEIDEIIVLASAELFATFHANRAGGEATADADEIDGLIEVFLHELNEHSSVTATSDPVRPITTVPASVTITVENLRGDESRDVVINFTHNATRVNVNTAGNPWVSNNP